MTIDELRTAYEAAVCARSAGIAAARAAESAAKRAYDEAIASAAIAENADMYTGILVEWDRRYRYGPPNATDRRGRYEICTLDTVFAANVGTYRKPAIGARFIRLQKKRRDTEHQVWPLSEGWPWPRWLPEGETPK